MTASTSLRHHEAYESPGAIVPEMSSSPVLSASSRSSQHLSDVNNGERRSYELQTLLRGSVESQARRLPLSSTELGAVESDAEDDDAQSTQRVEGISNAYTTEEERVIVRTFDTRLVLFMCLLYMLSFLDRSNIGNARIAGLETDLSLQPGQFAWLLTAFYITYICFEWMALLYRVIPAHIYISLCVFSWGAIASLQSVATSFTSLIILRAMLGIAEAAFGPGVPFYLSFFYKRNELAYRVGLFISAAPLATSFASTLAWLIVQAFQDGPFQPWRALFLIEGLPSVFVAVSAWYVIPDSPATARYLSPRQRKVASLRLECEEPLPYLADKSRQAQQQSDHPNRLSLHDILHTLKDPKAYLTSLMFFSANVSFSSLPVFLPTILTSTNLTALQSQLLSAPPYLLSFPFLLLTSHLSDRIPNTRSTIIVLTSLLSSLSYLSIALAGHYHDLLGPTATFVIRYTAVFGASMGFFAAITLIITWTINNQATASGKGTGIALLNVVGQCGPLVGTRLYPDSDAPFFVSGMLFCAGFMAAVAALAAGLRWWLGRLNKGTGCEDAADSRQGLQMDQLNEERDEDGEDEWGKREDASLVDGLVRQGGEIGQGGKRRRNRRQEQGFRYML